MVEKTIMELTTVLGMNNDDAAMVVEMCQFGGCYIFAKMFQKLFGGTLYLNREKEHCIIKNKTNFYDSYGIVKDISGFERCNLDDEIYMEDSYGLDDYYDCDMSWVIAKIC